ncbi:hypothetical protein [Streptomyces coelicoflavus]|uniref:hypothetical protein n=1 Tax=Streptomyces coelicoflavus TaxID=285562 RepID=UPI0036CD9BB6
MISDGTVLPIDRIAVDQPYYWGQKKRHGTKCWADKAYQGASPAIRVPIRGKHLRGSRRRHDRDQTKIRSLGDRAMAIPKSRLLLRKPRCSTTQITAVLRAVAALELAA